LSNFFDDLNGLTGNLEEAKKQVADIEARGAKLDQLIHKVFRQTEEGRELLEIWQKALINRPTVTEVSTQFGAGIEEGKKTFIRGIVLTVERIERDE
jgi:hypothetical protein